MKTTTTVMRNHLDQEVTALCTCWTITRTDGQVLRFTDADEDVVQDGQTFKSIGAYKRTAIETTSTLSVDNLDIVGAASDLALPEDELRAGLFDNAEITIFITPWLRTVPGQIKMRRGFFGEVQTLPNGTFQVELRGIMQRLSYNYMDIFSATCLYDLGEPIGADGMGCGIPIRPDEVLRSTAYAVGDTVNAQQDGTFRGAVYSLPIGDPDFEIAGLVGNFDDSQWWTNVGAFDIGVDATEAYTGTYSAVGGTGAGTLRQDVDLTTAGAGMSLTALDAGAGYMTLNGWRRDNNDEGRLNVLFIDDKGNELDYGSQADWNNSGITLGTTLSLTGDFTIEFWINMEGTIGDEDGPGGTGTGTFAGSGNDICFENGFPQLRTNQASANPVSRITSPNALVGGQWTHLAFTRSGTDLHIYENGEQVAEVLASGYTGTFLFDYIGQTMDGTLLGQMMEFRIWSVARTISEINLFKDCSIDPATTGLERLYNFLDGTFDDATGNDAGVNPAGANAIVPATGPVAVNVLHTPGSTATFDTGLVDVGTTWVETGFKDRQVPIGSRFARIEFSVNVLTAPDADARLDNLNGYLIDVSQTGTLLCDTLGDVYWEATTAGTTAVSAPTFSGGVGTLVVDGGVTWEAKDAWTRKGRVLSSTDARTFICEVSDPRAVDAWFNGGTVTFQTGANAGVGMEVKSWDSTTRQLELFLSMPNPIGAGDLFCVYPGCDKSRISCAAIFDNIRHMFATPDVPGQDELLRYPDQN